MPTAEPPIRAPAMRSGCSGSRSSITGCRTERRSHRSRGQDVPGWRAFLAHAGNDPCNGLLAQETGSHVLVPGTFWNVATRRAAGWLRGLRLRLPRASRPRQSKPAVVRTPCGTKGAARGASLASRHAAARWPIRHRRPFLKATSAPRSTVGRRRSGMTPASRFASMAASISITAHGPRRWPVRRACATARCWKPRRGGCCRPTRSTTCDRCDSCGKSGWPRDCRCRPACAAAARAALRARCPMPTRGLRAKIARWTFARSIDRCTRRRRVTARRPVRWRT